MRQENMPRSYYVDIVCVFDFNNRGLEYEVLKRALVDLVEKLGEADRLLFVGLNQPAG